MGSVYIGYIEIPDVVAAKIMGKDGRGISPDDVRSAVQVPARHESARWLDDERGPRVLAIGRDATGRRIKVILYPVDTSDGTWRLATAFHG